VVGLGPAGSTYVTGEVRALMAGAARTFLRTARHPAAESLSGFVALDRLYESAGTFAEVYGAIVEVLVAAATAHAPGMIVYAVPGSPLVAERTVELLRHEARVDLTIVPCLSFLDLAWERLAIDPLAEGVRLIDAAQFALAAWEDRGPFLVAQCWSQSLLSDIKLSPRYDGEGPEPDVVLLHHLGLEDEQVVRVGWWDLDRALQPDHLTSLYIGESTAPAGTAHEMARLASLVETLRERCPWDKAQTHGSLMPHLLEESYEVLDALRELDRAPAGATHPGDHLQEELGDLLFQIVFHARLAQEEGLFTLADVARGVHDKLVHRHPHVFADGGSADGVMVEAQQVVADWEEIKKKEKGRASVTEGMPVDLPALLLSTKLQRKALSVGLPGLADSATDLVARVDALAHLETEPVVGTADATLPGGGDEHEQRVGDVLFHVADLARRLGVDPELALRWRALALRDEVVAREGASAALPIPGGHTH
jgi:tetrapyrrole methylase family protein/MazG family protein